MTTARVFVLVLVLVGLAIGSVIRPVYGQTDAVPYRRGQRLTLSYGERSVDCTILDTRGVFVRCEDSRPPDPFSRAPAYVTWYNVATVEYVSIREPQR